MNFIGIYVVLIRNHLGNLHLISTGKSRYFEPHSWPILNPEIVLTFSPVPFSPFVMILTGSLQNGAPKLKI